MTLHIMNKTEWQSENCTMATMEPDSQPLSYSTITVLSEFLKKIFSLLFLVLAFHPHGIETPVSQKQNVSEKKGNF